MRKIIAIPMVIILAISLIMFAGCSERVTSFTDDVDFGYSEFLDLLSAHGIGYAWHGDIVYDDGNYLSVPLRRRMFIGVGTFEIYEYSDNVSMKEDAAMIASGELQLPEEYWRGRTWFWEDDEDIPWNAPVTPADTPTQFFKRGRLILLYFGTGDNAFDTIARNFDRIK